ncbi:MAG: hypothetical protein XD65_0876 [Caldanaerobacter subterraneus]|jgi:hypothetical protein|uniref:Uncharacterized protein n=1 Tax=Thermoanaerobacter pseudethanolicus (strain ATCC 33223 / 39E) TaxID=340099 RepID=B0KCR3_THEP3|nr:hypothetical protein Teth514_0322 [Thermoanaerobacter sp. X514]ABY95520.1 hypothetical protein Teth39_1887 [Thermoanaerobacter pseudethanolicus ATCC 33223]KUK34793.1 MAG: hypothetical protein XD65_0876 [Caldanaerobacter subterraneus]
MLYLKEELNNKQIQVPNFAVKIGLKGKPGESPARSRHCDGELFTLCHCPALSEYLVNAGWEGVKSDEPKSGDLPVFVLHLLYGR